MTEIDPLRFVLSCLFGPGPLVNRLRRHLARHRQGATRSGLPAAATARVW